MRNNSLTTQLQTRSQAINAWLEENAPYAAFDQRHLDSNTPERAYWHLGYAAALADVQASLGVDARPAGSADTARPFRPAGRGAVGSLAGADRGTIRIRARKPRARSA